MCGGVGGATRGVILSDPILRPQIPEILETPGPARGLGSTLTPTFVVRIKKSISGRIIILVGPL